MDFSSVLGDLAVDFIHDLGRYIATVTAELRSFNFLLQRLSIAVQRVCMNGTTRS